MEADHIQGIRTLLEEAERAHGAYEATELNGVYDDAWPDWYAAYAVAHGIGDLVGRDVTASQLATLLASSYAEYERAEPQPGEAWALWAARRLATEL